MILEECHVCGKQTEKESWQTYAFCEVCLDRFSEDVFET